MEHSQETLKHPHRDSPSAECSSVHCHLSAFQPYHLPVFKVYENGRRQYDCFWLGFLLLTMFCIYPSLFQVAVLILREIYILIVHSMSQIFFVFFVLCILGISILNIFMLCLSFYYLSLYHCTWIFSIVSWKIYIL